jgi:hypothetical protein
VFRKGQPSSQPYRGKTLKVLKVPGWSPLGVAAAAVHVKSVMMTPDGLPQSCAAVGLHGQASASTQQFATPLAGDGGRTCLLRGNIKEEAAGFQDPISKRSSLSFQFHLHTVSCARLQHNRFLGLYQPLRYHPDTRSGQDDPIKYLYDQDEDIYRCCSSGLCCLCSNSERAKLRCK